MDEARALDQQILDEIIHRIVEVAQPDQIMLFGSAARVHCWLVQGLRSRGASAKMPFACPVLSTLAQRSWFGRLAAAEWANRLV